MNVLANSMQDISCTDSVLKSGGGSFMVNFANGLRK